MNKLAINQKFKRIVTVLKPWVLGALFVVFLRYTGILGGIAYVAQSAAMETGVMNIDVDEEPVTTAFDFNFQLKDLDGNVVSAESFKGKVLFINLWATWCGPCRVEMPSIQELYNEKKNDVAFIMLSLDRPGQHHKIKKYVEDKGYDFPVYTLASPPTEQLSVPSIPTTFVITKDGMISTKKVGAANYNTERFKRKLGELVRGG